LPYSVTMLPSRGVALVVMAKAPQAGASKTRLLPRLDADQAATLALCLTQDSVRNVRALDARVCIAYTPAGGRDVLEPALAPGLRWFAQRGKDLGARMEHAIARAARWGARPILLIGTDSPHLPIENIALAIETLQADRADLVLGPAEDGGYYLVGMSRPAPGLFDGVAWSTSRAYAETAANAQRQSLRLWNAPMGYDIDTPADLARLYEQICTDPRLRDRVPGTARWLAEHSALLALNTVAIGEPE